jgi:perosamine synthetase
MDRIRDIAEDRGCMIMTDCAHSPGAEYKGRKAGSLGDMGAFSFHQQKNMSTLGEGGMLTTNDENLYARANMFRNHGREGHSHKFSMVGHNYRMTDVQGAVGLVQLRKLDSLNSRRMALARLLTSLLREVRGVVPPHVGKDVKHVFHLYNLLVGETLGMSRDQFIEKLGTDYGICAGTHYEPIHLADIYVQRGSKEGDCPVAERVGGMNLTLPIHPRLGEDDIHQMGKAVREIAQA